MDLYLNVIDPIAFSIGPINVRWYGILIGTGIILAFFVAQREMVKRGFDQDFLTDMLIWAVPLSIVGARIYYVIFQWEIYKDDPVKIIRIDQGGLAIHGALIAAVIVAYIFCKKRNVSFWKVADIVAPSVLIGQIIGRWGNFINQEAHGGPVTREFLEGLFLPNWIIDQMNIDGTYYHPTFLYESLWNVVGLILLLLLRRLNPRRGELFLTYVIWYSLGRFYIEGIRTDSLINQAFGGLRQAQLISLLLIILSIILIVYRRIKVKPPKYYED